MSSLRRSPACLPPFLLGLLLGVSGLGAQVADDHGPLILELPATTAAQAMGNAPYLSRGGPGVLFYNAATLAEPGGLAGAVQRYGSRATLLDLAASAEWWGGGVGLSLRALSFEGGSSSRTPGEGVLYGRGSDPVSQLAASAGYGRRFGRMAVGATGTLVELRSGGEREAGVAVGLGAVVGAGPLRVGLSVRNLGPDLDPEGRELSLPHRVELGASARGFRLGPLDLGASGSVSRLADGEVIPAAGVELAYWPVAGRTFVVRGGVRRIPDGPAQDLSLGAAFQGDQIVLEYAYQGFDGLDGAHRFGIGWR